MNHPASFASDPLEVIRQKLQYLSTLGYPSATLSLDTLHILRASRRPYHHLYDISFQDTAQHAWTMRFHLCRYPNGSWMVVGFSDISPQEKPQAPGSTDLPQLVLTYAQRLDIEQTPSPAFSKAKVELWHILVSLRTRPGGKEQALAIQNVFDDRVGKAPQQERARVAWEVLQAFEHLAPPPQEPAARWNPYFYFCAFGEVIDRGFDIVQVRLVSLNGVVLEDRVEEGLVLFWSNETYPAKPLQAELYNRAGHLVSSQTVLPSRLFSP